MLTANSRHGASSTLQAVKNRRMPSWLTLVLLLGSLIGSVNGAKRMKQLTEIPRGFRNLCSDINASPLQGKAHARVLTWLLEATNEQSLLSASSPQHQGACWMLFGDPKRNKVKGNRAWFRQRYAVSVFFYGTKGPTAWYPDIGNPNATTSAIARDKANDWLSNSHECTWYGLTCQSLIPFRGKTVTSLDISFFGVGGILPRELGLLTELKEVDLHGNDLQGVIPLLAVVNWKKLESLSLYMNGFFGSLHAEMGDMVKLKQLKVFGNYFAGTIPRELAQCTQLEEIDLYANAMQGTIPTELGTLSRLRKLDLHDNDLVGSMPQEICNLRLPVLISDCLGPNPEVRCDCCTVCCRGLPNLACVVVKTGEAVYPD